MVRESVFIVPAERIRQSIYVIRRQKVMLDSDLAELYGVETKVLNQAVKRNISRFPEDFMFQLTETEAEILRSQLVTSKGRRGGRRRFREIVEQLTVEQLRKRRVEVSRGILIDYLLMFIDNLKRQE